MFKLRNVIEELELGAAEIKEDFTVQLWVNGKTKIGGEVNLAGKTLPNDSTGKSHFGSWCKFFNHM